jgi:hypothetical protein
VTSFRSATVGSGTTAGVEMERGRQRLHAEKYRG